MDAAGSNSSALDRRALAAFAIYLALSLFFFGRGLIGHFSTWYLGRGPDPAQSIWFLNWWAYAIKHRANPFLTKFLFAPAGANLAWATTFPLAALAALPITYSFGPVAAYNILCLLAPALAGWAAFVLCRWITHEYWPSVAAGWVFGFSSYIVSAILTHLHSTMVFPLPLIFWVVLRRLNGELGPGRFVAALGLLIAVEFALFAEAIASVTLIGGFAFLLGVTLAKEESRRRLWMLVAPIGAAYALAALILSPYLYYMFAFGHPGGVVLNPMYHGADLVSLLIPTSVNELGRPAFLGSISRTYLATLTETGSYLALPLIAIAFLFGREHWREPRGRILIEITLIVCVLAMGTHFVIAGHPTIGAPWMLFAKLPLVDKALPVRLMVYVFLALAIIVAIWLSSARVGVSYRCVMGGALVLFMLPNLSAGYWKSPYEVPRFFSSGLYRQYLSRNENVMAIPALIFGDGMQWQVAGGMYFRLAGGYPGLSPLAPPQYARWPIMQALYYVAGVPDAGEQLKALLAHERVSAVIVGPLKYRMADRFDGKWTSATWSHGPLSREERARINRLLTSSLGVQPVKAGGVTLYRIAPGQLAPYREVSALEMQQRYVRTRFEVLLKAAHQYLAGGGTLDGLATQKAQVLKHVPDWFGGPAFPALSPNRIFQVEWALGQWHRGRVALGVQGSYAALQPLIRQYGPDASGVYFPFPHRLTSPPVADPEKSALMVMEFTPAGLARAAAATAIARSSQLP
jgi:hypothetical protein